MTARKTEPKVEETEEEPKKDETDKAADSGDAGSDSLDSRIRTVVKDVVDSLLGDRSESAGRRTQSDDEDELYQRVRKAQDKIKKDEEKEGRLTKVEEKLEKVFEKPPARDGIGGKVQRWFWGSED